MDPISSDPSVEDTSEQSVEVNAMVDRMVAIMDTLGKRPDVFAVAAKMNWLAYQALIDAGFTDDQAFKILLEQGPVKLG